MARCDREQDGERCAQLFPAKLSATELWCDACRLPDFASHWELVRADAEAAGVRWSPDVEHLYQYLTSDSHGAVDPFTVVHRAADLASQVAVQAHVTGGPLDLSGVAVAACVALRAWPELDEAMERCAPARGRVGPG